MNNYILDTNTMALRSEVCNLQTKTTIVKKCHDEAATLNWKDNVDGFWVAVGLGLIFMFGFVLGKIS